MPSPELETLIAPGRAALVLQELQNGVVGDAAVFAELAAAVAEVGAIAHAAVATRAARSAGVPVVHTTAENLPGGFGTNHNARLFAGSRAIGAGNAPGSVSVDPVSEVYVDGDVVLPRYHGLSPLTGGPLDSLLRNSGVTTLVVAGVSLNVAIPNVVFDAVNRSYQVVLLTDAVAGVPVAYGEHVVRNSLSLLATLATSDEIASVWNSTATN